MRFLKKVGDYLAPILTTNSFVDFKSAFSTVMTRLNDPAPDSTIAFIGAINNVQDYLADEVNDDKPDQPCVHYLVGGNLLTKLVSAIDESLPPDRVEPILKFFSAFVDTCLNRLFPQVSVHRPFTKFLTLLPMLCLKDPTHTLEFASDLWNNVKDFPLALELISSDNEQPLVDFFCLTSFAPGENGELSRSALLSVAGLEIQKFQDYLEARYFPQLATFILNTALCGSTIQFNGSLSSLTEWIDFLLLQVDKFPCEVLLKGISEVPESQRILAIAFLLSFFSADAIVRPIGDFALSVEFLTSVESALKNSEAPADQKSAVAFLKIVFESELDLGPLLPPPAPNPSGILSLLPPRWLAGLEGSTDMSAYEADAMVRLQFFSGRHSTRSDSGIFGALLGLLARFKNIPLSLGLSATKAITGFLSLAPDLIGAELAAAFAAAVESLTEVRELALPGETMPDSPELRAIVLTEFGKEVHATFVASERLGAIPDD
jgi:hypothetical protein